MATGSAARISIFTVALGLAAAATATPTCCCAVVVLLTSLLVSSQNSRSPTPMASAEVLPISTTPFGQDLHIGALHGVVLGNAEQRADQHALAGEHAAARCGNGDRSAGLDIIVAIVVVLSDRMRSRPTGRERSG